MKRDPTKKQFSSTELGFCRRWQEVLDFHDLRVCNDGMIALSSCPNCDYAQTSSVLISGISFSGILWTRIGGPACSLILLGLSVLG